MIPKPMARWLLLRFVDLITVRAWVMGADHAEVRKRLQEKVTLFVDYGRKTA